MREVRKESRMSLTLYRCHYCGCEGAPNHWQIVRPEFGKPQTIKTCNRSYGTSGEYNPGSCMARAVADGYRKASVVSR